MNEDENEMKGNVRSDKVRSDRVRSDKVWYGKVRLKGIDKRHLCWDRGDTLSRG